MRKLELLSGEEFDRYWLDVFSGHHMSAIMMTDVALAGNASPEARKLQDQIRGGQLRQIDTMNELRTQVKH